MTVDNLKKIYFKLSLSGFFIMFIKKHKCPVKKCELCSAYVLMVSHVAKTIAPT